MGIAMNSLEKKIIPWIKSYIFSHNEAERLDRNKHRTREENHSLAHYMQLEASYKRTIETHLDFHSRESFIRIYKYLDTYVILSEDDTGWKAEIVDTLLDLDNPFGESK